MNARTLPIAAYADTQIAQLRIPPHSIEGESSVLGGLLLSNAAWDNVGDLLTDEDFYRYEHRLIFGAVGALINAGKPADVITVYEYLLAQGHGDEVGGLPYLNSLQQYLPSAANIRRYAEIVRERSILRKLVAASDQIATAAFNPQGKTVAAILDEAGSLMMGLSLGSTVDDWVGVESTVVGLLDRINDRAEGRGDKDIISTGLRDLDQMLDEGMRPGQFIVIGARPSMGKSALGVTIGMAAAEAGHAVGMFSLEMPKEELVMRQVSMVSHIHLTKLRLSERLNDIDWPRLTAAVDKLRCLNFHVSEHSGVNINQIRARARALKRRHGLKLLVVDYLQLCAGTNSKDSRHNQLGEVSRGLKSLAKELHIPIIGLAQLGRDIEKRTNPRPMLSDLKDCGDIEQDADIVMFIDRPIFSKPDLGFEWKTYAEVVVAKQRNGPTGSLSLRYVGENVAFLDWDGEKPAKPGSSRGSL